MMFLISMDDHIDIPDDMKYGDVPLDCDDAVQVPGEPGLQVQQEADEPGRG